MFSYALQMDALLLLYRASVTDNEMYEAGNWVTLPRGKGKTRHDKLCGKRNGCNVEGSWNE